MSDPLDPGRDSGLFDPGRESALFDPGRYRSLFYLAGAWNLSAAAVALGFPEFHAQMLYGQSESLSSPAAVINARIVWLSVAFFGVGYLIVARDPSKNHGLVLIAALGKASVGALWLWGYRAHEVAGLGLAGAIGDLAFAGLFAAFLLRARSTP